MTTQMKAAKAGRVTEEMKLIAEIEDVPVEWLRQRVARGTVIIPRNMVRENVKIVGIGEGLTTKVNVNIGTSTLYTNLDMEIEKAKIAIKYGTDTIMDLSTGGNLDYIRRELMKVAPVPFGTVPIYQAFIEVAKKKGAGIYMTEDDVFRVIEKHLKDGVDFMTVHVGITKDIVKKVVDGGRVAGIVSRGGAILAAWMLHNDEENPLYKNYDYLLELAAEYDAVLSLGDALRPGSVLDAHDYAQMAEMLNIARLVERAWKKNVQVMVEGPGHVPLHQVAANVRLEKALCKGVPYYVLGPLVTDIAAGYDHIAAAIGAAIAAAEGVDLICYLTPAEHLSLPDPKDVKLGLIAAKIAGHAGDIVKLGEKALKHDLEMSIAREKLDWRKMYKLSLDPEKARAMHERYSKVTEGPCTMCGDLCVYLLLKKFQREC
ncbi:MAG: phosphomethylpyrimidine synthase ThiC [Candidatus Baldrarchaeia archaeon]